MKKNAFIIMLINCLVFVLILPSGAHALNNQSPGVSDELIQFVSGGHVLGFGSGEIYLAGCDHILRVEFVGANSSLPVVETPSGSSGAIGGRNITRLDRVTYRDVWDGVDLVYERHHNGLAKSTYYIAPGAGGSEHIRLRYNVPVTEISGGGLSFTMARGVFCESGPVAWQEIEGRRVPVEAAFRVFGEQEAGFRLGVHDPAYPLVIDPVLTWNTFMGSGVNDDSANSIVVDRSGNVYVAGSSFATWGTPVNAFSGSPDAFAAKLDAGGNRLWHTFLGSGSVDEAYGIALDDSGNVYLAGASQAAWGVPINPYSGLSDAFAAKLDADGILLWHTFWGGAASSEAAAGIALDGTGNVYFGGKGQGDAFAVKLDPDGAMLWDTLLGSAASDAAYDLTVDSGGNVFLAGMSDATWGTPVNPYAGGNDCFAAMLDTNGNLLWNTFIGAGGGGDDSCSSIALDNNGNVFVAGHSDATWGAPVAPFSGANDAFAAGLDGNGNLIWNTFLGSGGIDRGRGIAVDRCGSVFVSGNSDATWGAPSEPYAGGKDAFVAELDSNGNLLHNTFLGGALNENAMDLAVYQGNLYSAGQGETTWGAPVNPYSGFYDAFVAQMAIETPRTILNVLKEGNGTGLVTSTAEVVHCGEMCEGVFCPGETITLTAVADEGSSFSGWSGEGCTGTGTCTVTMDIARTVTAVFDAISPGSSGGGSCFIDAFRGMSEKTGQGLN